MTRIAAVLGWPIAHSKSPAMHDAAFAACGLDAKMLAIAVPPDELAAEIARLRAVPMLGASVTVPHKVAVAALCDERSADARAIGAVNCLQLVDGKLVGHNTDAIGFRDALPVDPRGQRAVLLGSGGASRAVDHALRIAGASVDVLGRARAADLPAALARADLLVDCTPTGLDPSADAAFAASLPLDALPPHALVATLVYHRRTALLDRAAALGHPTLDGRGMLLHQAAHAFALWTARPAPLDVMRRALDAALA